MLTITLDTKRTLGELTSLARDQLPFATANAINYTGDEIQEAERQHIRASFTLRRPDFILMNTAKRLSPAARKDRLEITLGTDPRVDFMPKFEGGDPKRPQGRAIAVGKAARRTARDIIPKSQRPRAFGFKVSFPTKAGGRMYQGERGTFMVRKADGSGFIAQRTGRGKASKIEILYVLLSRPARTPATLTFVPIAERIVSERWERNLSTALDSAIRTAR